MKARVMADQIIQIGDFAVKKLSEGGHKASHWNL